MVLFSVLFMSNITFYHFCLAIHSSKLSYTELEM